jgi:hypothetical protein
MTAEMFSRVMGKEANRIQDLTEFVNERVI